MRAVKAMHPLRLQRVVLLRTSAAIRKMAAECFYLLLKKRSRPKIATASTNISMAYGIAH
jgi:hypothetical protein